MGKRILKPTEKQIATNRANARRSSGPITAAGKAKASRNALKHGLLAKEIVIDDGEGAESREEFDSVLLALTDRFDSQGPLEEMLVEKIAVAYWRMRRAYRFEVGLVRKKLDNTRDQYYHGDPLEIGNKEKRDDEIDARIAEAQRLHRDWQDDKKWFTKMHKDGNDLAEIYDFEDNWDWVCEQASEFVDESTYTPAALRAALREAGWSDDRIWQCHIGICAEQMESLAQQIQDLQKKKQSNRLAVQVRKKLGAVPGGYELDQLLKYEGSIERQFYKAVDQLERLQRMRAGDNVPAPISIDLAVNDDGKS
jgi:hypothetical protein